MSGIPKGLQATIQVRFIDVSYRFVIMAISRGFLSPQVPAGSLIPRPLTKQETSPQVQAYCY